MHILLKILFPYPIANAMRLCAFRVCVLLWGVLTLAACERRSVMPELDAADSLMERRPDSALALLQRVDTSRLVSRHMRARYAMLMSMALDKNYIDLKDFRILQPAIVYYEKQGTPTEQLRTFYYQGRIYDNACDMSRALQSYMKALERGKDSEDTLTKARAYFAQLNPNSKLKNFNKAIEVGKKAACYFRRFGRTDSYAHCLTDIANIYTLNNEEDSAWKYFAECKALWPYLSEVRKQSFYNNYLVAVYSFSGKDSIKKAIAEYETNVPPTEWDHLTLACAYTEINDFKKAQFVISRYKLHTSAFDDKRYYSALYYFFRKKGLYKEANDAYWQYNILKDSINKVALRENTRLAEAQHQLKLDIREARQARIRNFWIAAGSIVVLLLVVGLGYYRLRLSRMQKRLAEQEKEHYRLQYELLRDEHGSLQQLLADGNRLDAAARDIVRKRLALLNEFFRAHITEDSREPEKHVAQILSDREAFMQSTREVFAVSHPGFIRYLEQKGLTEWEVGYCCLFALGLNGKEVGRYTHFGNHYKINIQIRKKLGLDSHSTNLNLYIMKLLQDNEAPSATREPEA